MVSLGLFGASFFISLIFKGLRAAKLNLLACVVLSASIFAMMNLLATYGAGRVVIHCLCIVKGGKVKFHLQGIRRELPRVTWERAVVTTYFAPVLIGLFAKLAS